MSTGMSDASSTIMASPSTLLLCYQAGEGLAQEIRPVVRRQDDAYCRYRAHLVTAQRRAILLCRDVEILTHCISIRGTS